MAKAASQDQVLARAYDHSERFEKRSKRSGHRKKKGPMITGTETMSRCPAVILVLALLRWAEGATSNGPTPQECINRVGGQLIHAGKLELDGRRMTCGNYPIVLDNNLDDLSAAYPKFGILNPRLLARLKPAVKFWVFGVASGLLMRGQDPIAADCFSTEMGEWVNNRRHRDRSTGTASLRLHIASYRRLLGRRGEGGLGSTATTIETCERARPSSNATPIKCWQSELLRNPRSQ